MKKHYRKGNDCLNCGTILEGKFCHNCGQENLEMKESFGHMITHAVSDYFHFDDQFFHTMRPLFFKPGHLTNEYTAGHRAQYLHPVKMYIFISLLFFVLAFGGKHQVKDVKQTAATKHTADSVKRAVIDSVANTRHFNAKQKAELVNKISVTPESEDGHIKYNIDYNIGDNIDIFGLKVNKKSNYEDYLKEQEKLSPADRDNIVERFIVRKSYDWTSQGKDAQKMFTEALKHNAPKVMFLILPLFALILKIAFSKNRKFYVEHIIYAIHLHCFIFLFLIAVMLINRLLPHNWQGVANWVSTLATLTVIWYIYRSLRVVYNRSRWRTVSKMLGVSVMYFMVFTLSFLIILIVTAVTTV
ncbi:DUF3667 domain-containing protein [Mucilaginibacter terrigena]|uniref:DUF3667 domain-containing protein n=1 Tax=Mucilaginibacter terrigena TaxID=2492395 RepID=A0A4Q5LSQ1_9SPHI|nr:DUF3667 domain-containing protein [Mucilaginibacter terrigena]RYU92413.1 DUF3667 domain-containing protein [Mucilaginibacter terrigena]